MTFYQTRDNSSHNAKIRPRPAYSFLGVVSRRCVVVFEFAREGRYCFVRITERVCSAARLVEMPELLLDVYTPM